MDIMARGGGTRIGRIAAFSLSRPLLFIKKEWLKTSDHVSLTGERGVKMKKIGWGFSLAMILFPTFVSADCAGLGRYTSWILETSHSLVLYAGAKPLARVEIPNCEIRPRSTIRLRTSYVCEQDEMMIDGVACHIITVEKL